MDFQIFGRGYKMGSCSDMRVLNLTLCEAYGPEYRRIQNFDSENFHVVSMRHITTTLLADLFAGTNTNRYSSTSIYLFYSRKGNIMDPIINFRSVFKIRYTNINSIHNFTQITIITILNVSFQIFHDFANLKKRLK